MLNAGTKLGPYEILSPIGAGGMGEVYKARDTRLDRLVAVKVVSEQLGTDPTALARFEREAKAVAALSHPNIMAIHDIGRDGDITYAVMELLDGRSLRELLAGGAFSLSRTTEMALQIAKGLSAAHAKGIVHRDLKPGNIFVTKDGQVKILDFGLAKQAAGTRRGAQVSSEDPTAEVQTGPGIVLGTMGYMAPEQIIGEGVDARTDLFAFGVVLYEMLAGKKPFERSSASDTLAAILKEDPPEIIRKDAVLPPALCRIVNHCLEKAPEARFQSARDIAFALETLGGSTGATSGSAAAALVLPASRPRWLLLISLTVLALAAGGVVGFFIHRSLARPSQPTFRQLTFRRGYMGTARFAPDGKEAIYSAAWDGKSQELYSVRLGSPESRPLGFGRSGLLCVLLNGDLAIKFGNGALAQAPINGGAPREILGSVEYADAGPDPQHLLVVRTDSGISRIEYPIGKVLLESSKGIGCPRLSHKGDRVAFEQGAELMLLGADGKAVSISKGWVGIVGLAWTPSDDEIWFTASKDGQNLAIYAVTPGGRERLVYRAPGQLVIQDISADGKVLFCRQTTRYGFVAWDAKAGEERDLSWFDYSNLGAISPDGRRVLFHEDGEAVGGKPFAYMRGTDGSPAIRLGDGYPWDFSPDGEWVIASVPGEKGAQLQMIPTGAGQPMVLTSDGLDHRYARWMPDGRSFIFYGNEPGRPPRFYIQSTKGGAPKPLTPEGKYPPNMAISPDGRLLAFCDLGKEGIFLVSTGGGDPRPLVEDQIGRPITFSADGKALLVRDGMMGKRVFRVDLSTGQGKVVRELNPTGIQGMPIIFVTPDEKTYAYQYYIEMSDLFVAEGLK